MNKTISKLKQSALILGVAVAAASLVGAPVHAIESYGVGGVPANPQANNPRSKSIFIYRTKGGKQLNDAIKLVNNTEEVKTLAVYPVDSQLSSDGAFACAQKADKPSDVGTWIKLSKSSVTLQPNTAQDVPFTVAVPTDAAIGEHNGCIAIQAVEAPTQSDQNGIVLSFRSAIRVSVMVPGLTFTQLAFSNLTTTPIKDQQLRLSPTLRNDGNVSVDADIKAGLRNILGKDTVTSGGKYSILNKTEASFNFEVPSPFWGGWYRQVAAADYKALEGAVENNASKHADSAAKWVFVKPAPKALLIESATAALLVLLLLILTARYHRRRTMVAGFAKHTVKSNETLESLAKRKQVTWQQLAHINHLKAPYTIQRGQVILLPQLRSEIEPVHQRIKRTITGASNPKNRSKKR